MLQQTLTFVARECKTDIYMGCNIQMLHKKKNVSYGGTPAFVNETPINSDFNRRKENHGQAIA